MASRCAACAACGGKSLDSILGSTSSTDATQDLVLYFNAFAFCLFGLPHIFKEDGDLTEMGFSWTTDFMPRSRSIAEVPSLAHLLVQGPPTAPDAHPLAQGCPLGPR